MNGANCPVDRAMQAQIDRLVAGELPEGERRNLLVWLDEDVRRWRACAISFLESQSWEAAAGSLPAPGTHRLARSASGGTSAPICRALARPDRRRLQALAIAISIALAFATGIFTARLWPSTQPGMLPQVVEQSVPSDDDPPSQPNQPLVATVAVRTNLDPNVPAQLQLPVGPVADGKLPESSISDYERQQWKRQGFELTEEPRYLPARLPDGSEIVVPINKVHVKFKGMPVS